MNKQQIKESINNEIKQQRNEKALKRYKKHYYRMEFYRRFFVVKN